MKYPIVILVAMLMSSHIFAAENYILEINGRTYDVGLGEEKRVELPGGETLRLNLSMKEYVSFESELYKFSHKSIYKATKTDLGEGIFQTMIITPLGTGVLIQEYTTMNPTMLVDMMLRELTKEEVDYGYAYKEKKITRKVGARTLKGKQATTTYQDEEWTRAVYAYGTRDAGILVITFMEKDNEKEDKHLVDDLWKTLELKM